MHSRSWHSHTKIWPLWPLIGVGNNFSSYLQNQLSYVSINGFNSNLEYIHCGFPQGFIQRQLLYLIYIKDLNCAMRYSSSLCNDTNLLITTTH